jgi:TPR repeat protein
MDSADAVRYFKLSSDQENARAQYNYGIVYEIASAFRLIFALRRIILNYQRINTFLRLTINADEIHLLVSVRSAMLSVQLNYSGLQQGPAIWLWHGCLKMESEVHKIT